MGTSKDGKIDEHLRAKVGAISGTLFGTPDAYGYAGKGVRRGEKDKIVFWYRPEKSKTYRAVFGDLPYRRRDRGPTAGYAAGGGTGEMICD